MGRNPPGRGSVQLGEQREPSGIEPDRAGNGAARPGSALINQILDYRFERLFALKG
jgi:hypothetical protein